ncbi:hypothetical protein VTK26DRAFT_9007 [Humicola hyalothermophila]
MSNNFFDGTLDDFLDDHRLFELANLDLPPPLSLRSSQFRLSPLQPPVFPRFAAFSVPGHQPSLFASSGREEHGSRRPDRQSPFIARNPTQPGHPSAYTANRPFPVATFNQNTTTIRQAANQGQQPQPQGRARALPAFRSLLFPDSPLPPRTSPFPFRAPVHDHAAVATSANSNPHPEPPTDPSPVSNPISPGLRLPAMSSSMRARRDVRSGDLAMPSISAPSNEPSTSGVKRKRDDSPAAAAAAEDDNDNFGKDPFAEDAEAIDLVDKDESALNDLANTNKTPKKKSVKLKGVTCIVCMDSCTDLTVTHCGHLYCGECLQTAFDINAATPLHAEKPRICPYCRQKIDKKPLSTGKYKHKAKGYYPLEIKMVTRKTLGRRST